MGDGGCIVKNQVHGHVEVGVRSDGLVELGLFTTTGEGTSALIEQKTLRWLIAQLEGAVREDTPPEEATQEGGTADG